MSLVDGQTMPQLWTSFQQTSKCKVKKSRLDLSFELFREYQIFFSSCTKLKRSEKEPLCDFHG